VARSFCRWLERAGHTAVSVRSLAAARECVSAARSETVGGYAVVLLDLRLPDGEGDELLPELRALRPEPAVAVISGTANGERALRLLAQGIWVIPKPIGGRAFVHLVERLAGRAPPEDAARAFCLAHGLSPKETDVVRASAEGLTTAEVSQRLGCAAHTITEYWQRIFAKTSCRSQPAVFSAILRFADNEPRPGRRTER
jgi:DNA-binding NarL/FixJ family response regulator